MYAITTSETDLEKDNLEAQIKEASDRAAKARLILTSTPNWGQDHLIAYNMSLNRQIKEYEDLRDTYIKKYSK